MRPSTSDYEEIKARHRHRWPWRLTAGTLGFVMAWYVGYGNASVPIFLTIMALALVAGIALARRVGPYELPDRRDNARLYAWATWERPEAEEGSLVLGWFALRFRYAGIVAFTVAFFTTF